MDEEEFAKSLLAHERKEWQDPVAIVKRIGIKEDMVVADLASGPGFFTVPLANAVGRKGLVYAVDKSQVMLNYLETTIKKAKIDNFRVKIILAEVQKTGIPTASCDVVLFANILHDIADHGSFLAEVRRISKPESKIVDIDWRDVDNGFGPPLEVRLSEEKSREILLRNGFKFVRNVDSGPYHYGLLFGK